ncbi:hypothetical protein DL765_010237 [Monosporascus sp. GIB2]|nr:hypothetical protein DL765_010237 [Monosporascus sp. GIB2]
MDRTDEEVVYVIGTPENLADVSRSTLPVRTRPVATPFEDTTTNGNRKASQHGSDEGYSEPIGQVTRPLSPNLLCKMCGLTKCETHRSNAIQKQAIYNKERRKTARQQGLCHGCGRPAALPRSRCESCLEKQRTQQKTRVQKRKLQDRRKSHTKTEKAQQKKDEEDPPSVDERDTGGPEDLGAPVQLNVMAISSLLNPVTQGDAWRMP